MSSVLLGRGESDEDSEEGGDDLNELH